MEAGEDTEDLARDEGAQHVAERALRHSVIQRKVIGCFRSEWGAKAVSRNFLSLPGKIGGNYWAIKYN